MNTPQIRRVLFPTDFSACAEGAYRHAAWLADRFGAELHVLHVVEDPSEPERDWPEAPGTGHVRVTLANVCEDLGLPLPPPSHDYDPYDLVEVIEAEVVGRKAPEAILDYVHDEEVDLVVLGTHGRRGWRRSVLGSVAEAITRRAPCPVLTVRPPDTAGESPWPPERVLLAVDAAPGRRYATGTVPPAAWWAARLAVAYRAPLDLLHVVSPAVRVLGGPAEEHALQEKVRAALASLGEALQSATVPELPVTVVVRAGDPANEVRAEAEATGCHLLAVGTHGRTGPGRAILGSVAEELVRTAPCPVLVVRDALPTPDGAEAETQREVAS